MTDAARQGAETNAEKVLAGICAVLMEKMPEKAAP